MTVPSIFGSRRDKDLVFRCDRVEIDNLITGFDPPQPPLKRGETFLGIA
jgi:hypothetical protein